MSEHLREGWRRTAMPVAPLPEGLRWSHRPVRGPGIPQQHSLICKLDGKIIGHMRWLTKDYKRPKGFAGEITYIFVQPEYRRMGIASWMLERARSVDPRVQHSTTLTEDGAAWSSAVASKTAMDYWMGHRPTDDGAPAYDLLEPDANGDLRYPDDIYTHPHYYCGFAQWLPETMRTLQQARGNPSAQITVYRAQRSGAGLNTGDWVTLSRAYAEGDLASYEDAKGARSVEVYRVPAKDVRFAGDDLMEWGYWGPGATA